MTDISNMFQCLVYRASINKFRHSAPGREIIKTNKQTKNQDVFVQESCLVQESCASACFKAGTNLRHQQFFSNILYLRMGKLT